MGSKPDYLKELSALEEWDKYLMVHSCLPGPRSNLELASVVADHAPRELIMRYIQMDAEQAPENTAAIFLPICGVIGLGRLLERGEGQVLSILRRLAVDPRWRIRESVVIALEYWGKSATKDLLKEMTRWSKGNFYEQRAAIAALCHPQFLNDHQIAHDVLIILDNVTTSFYLSEHKKDAGFLVLRKTLGYGWSVAIPALPGEGKKLFEKWVQYYYDRDIRWIIRSNLKKDRLIRKEKDWVNKISQKIQ